MTEERRIGLVEMRPQGYVRRTVSLLSTCVARFRALTASCTFCGWLGEMRAGLSERVASAPSKPRGSKASRRAASPAQTAALRGRDTS